MTKSQAKILRAILSQGRTTIFGRRDAKAALSLIREVGKLRLSLPSPEYHRQIFLKPDATFYTDSDSPESVEHYQLYTEVVIMAGIKGMK